MQSYQNLKNAILNITVYSQDLHINPINIARKFEAKWSSPNAVVEVRYFKWNTAVFQKSIFWENGAFIWNVLFMLQNHIWKILVRKPIELYVCCLGRSL